VRALSTARADPWEAPTQQRHTAVDFAIQFSYNVAHWRRRSTARVRSSYPLLSTCANGACEMRNALKHLVNAMAVVAVIGAVFLSTARTGESQANAGATGQVRRTADGKPDFSGIWQANSLAYWDLLSHDARPIVANRGAYPDVPILAPPVVALGTIGWIPADVGVVDESKWQPLAAAVGQLGWQEFQSGRRDDLWKLLPQYYRPSAAEEKAAGKKE